MKDDTILKYIQGVNKLLLWSKYIPTAESRPWKKELKKIRRDLKRVEYAMLEKCSVATFGESQTGKSYLVSALLSDAGAQFKVTDGSHEYNFIDDLNPSEKGVQREATGVVTRFSTTSSKEVCPGYLKARILSVADIVLILSEAMYNQVEGGADLPEFTEINKILDGITLHDESQQSRFHEVFTEDDVMDIHDYLDSTNSLHQKTRSLLVSNLFDFLSENHSKLSEVQLCDLLCMLWNNNSDISRLFRDLMAAYRKINFENVVYIPFEGVLRKHGTLLDVRRLDEMYVKTTEILEDYKADIEIKTAAGLSVRIEKSFLSAIIAELSLTLPKKVETTRPFLKDIDILDFPGARRPEATKADKLGVETNLSIVFRRGKVTYLFNKYSDAKLVSSLLFCHNNVQSAESAMGGLLDNWLRNNVGKTPGERDAFISHSKLSPLFIICTWFNKDLEYQSQHAGDKLEQIWYTRFRAILENEVLKTNSYSWFNKWTEQSPAFNNIYMLRDFYYSLKNNIYAGWSENTPEDHEIIPLEYSEFRKDLKRSFVKYDFVQQHFVDPDYSWEQAASLNNDGTSLIIRQLGVLSPQLELARRERLSADVKDISLKLNRLADMYYHPESVDEELKVAIRKFGLAKMQLDLQFGKDPFFFGKMIDKMMINEGDIYERIFPILETYEEPAIHNGEYDSLRAMVGISDSNTKEQNLQLLMDYYGMDEDSCRETMSSMDIDLDRVIGSGSKIMTLPDLIVDKVSQYWYENILEDQIIKNLGATVPSVGEIVKRLWSLYNICEVPSLISVQVEEYLQKYNRSDVIGMISDCVAMNMNRFVSTFGQEYLPVRLVEKARERNEENRWNLVFHATEYVNNDICPDMDVLCDVDNLVKILKSNNPDDRRKLMRLPQYQHFFTWCDNMKVGFICSCEVPDYNIEANDELGKIRQIIKEA